jgi:hypothetical protein
MAILSRAPAKKRVPNAALASVYAEHPELKPGDPKPKAKAKRATKKAKR